MEQPAECGAIVGVVLAVYAPWAAEAWAPIVIGMISGAAGAAANGTSILKGVVFGAFSGAAYQAGGAWGSALWGGAESYMNGGAIGRGFIAAGIGAMGGAGGGGPSIKGFVTSAVLGGVATEVTGGKFKNGAASAAFMYAVSTGVQKSADSVVKATREGSTENLSANQEKALELLRSEGENLSLDIERRIEQAYAAGNYELGGELRDAWFALMRAKVSFSAGNYLIEAATSLLPWGDSYRVTGVKFNVNAGNVLDMYERGSIAPRSKGYFVDIPAGGQGVRELLAHEARHGTISNILDGKNEFLPQKIREHDADAL
jgi:hypothetical protein